LGWLSDSEAWIALITLIGLEIVLGIDNIVFLSILTSRLPETRQRNTRLIGLGLAMLGRIGLLLLISWVIRLTMPLFKVVNREMSGKDLIFVLGGVFLLAKSTHEIHSKVEDSREETHPKGGASMTAILIQIVLLDLIFSLDSVITAVGMTDRLVIMVIAVMIAVCFMMVLAEKVSYFVNHHPTFKMLALSFLILIGVVLIAEGFGQHIPKGYIYFAMGFSVLVEMLNMKIRASKARD
jgi:predicted tellurium resistance membrane protein TerC